MPHRVKAIKRLRTTVFVMVVSGMSLASLHAGRREPRLVRISEIRPIMNFSTVCVQGVLACEARVLRDGAVLYLIADDTGSLPVFLSRTPDGKLPRAGCPVTATGVLGMGAGNRVSMRVHDPEQIKVLKDIDPITVRGQVAEVRTPSPDSRAPHRIILNRPEGRLEVIHWFTPKQRIAVGDRLEAEGVLGFYRGRMRLKVRAPGDIRPYPEG